MGSKGKDGMGRKLGKAMLGALAAQPTLPAKATHNATEPVDESMQLREISPLMRRQGSRLFQDILRSEDPKDAQERHARIVRYNDNFRSFNQMWSDIEHMLTSGMREKERELVFKDPFTPGTEEYLSWRREQEDMQRIIVSIMKAVASIQQQYPTPQTLMNELRQHPDVLMLGRVGHCNKLFEAFFENGKPENDRKRAVAEVLRRSPEAPPGSSNNTTIK